MMGDIKTIDEYEYKLLKEIHYTASGWNDALTQGNFGDAKEWERHITRSIEHYDEYIVKRQSGDIEG